jgi:hypothetical protein
MKTNYKWDEPEERLVIQRVQDVEPILEANKRAFDVDDKRFKSEAMNHVARIPMVVIEKVKAETGVDLLNDEKALRAFLNDPDNRFLRTKPGKI